MEIDLQQLRSLYRRMPDEGLLDAFAQGRESYLPQAWDIITQEQASRGLPAPGDRREAALSNNPVIIGEQAVQIARGLLQAGSSPSQVRRRLEHEGLSQEDVDRLLPPLFDECRSVLDQRANREMVSGAVWTVGGSLVTLLSYWAVVQSGGTYVVAWGAVVFGAVRCLHGLSLALKGRRDWPK